LLLLRRPSVALALAAAAVVATLPAAAALPFLSSSRDATLRYQVAAPHAINAIGSGGKNAGHW
jgi:hypothetical protein